MKRPESTVNPEITKKKIWGKSDGRVKNRADQIASTVPQGLGFGLTLVLPVIKFNNSIYIYALLFMILVHNSVSYGFTICLPLVFWKMQWWYSSELSQRSPQYSDSETLQHLQSPEQVVKTVTFRLHSVPPVKSESLRVETMSTWFQSVAQFRNCSLRRIQCRAERWGISSQVHHCSYSPYQLDQHRHISTWSLLPTLETMVH